MGLFESSTCPRAQISSRKDDAPTTLSELNWRRDEHEQSKALSGEAPASTSRKLPSLRKILCIALGALVLIWVVPEIIAALGSIDIQGVERPYFLIFLFVWFDAIIPVFPSESLLNTSATEATPVAGAVEARST